MAIYKSWDALEQGMKSKCLAAVNTIANQSLDELNRNLEYFYTAPQGRYKRTGQLRDSGEMTAPPQTTVNGAAAEIGINTGTSYDPAGRDTEWIYNVANADGLLGNGYFWYNTEQRIQYYIDLVIPVYFK